MRYPEFLKPGGTIGFVAPSFGCTFEPYISRFENARKTFSEMGYGLDIGPNCDKAEGIGISNSPDKCGAEILEFYSKLIPEKVRRSVANNLKTGNKYNKYQHD